MPDISRTPDSITVFSDSDTEFFHPSGILAEVKGKKTGGDACVRTESTPNGLKIFIKAENSRPQFICLRWKHDITEPTFVLGDAWERGYGDLGWMPLSGERFMPWYFMVKTGTTVTGCGVKVRPNAFVSFECDKNGVTGWFDIRCGGVGVDISDRELEVATVVCKKYENISSFDATKDFCRVMCDDGIFPKYPVYGGNNWYYAYGNSSRAEIINDSKLIAKFSAGNENLPFYVIDDGWQKNPCAGPWEPNGRFGDMKTLASEMRAEGVRPGIWLRLLHDEEILKDHPEFELKRAGCRNIDPSVPGAKEYIKNVIGRIRDWGYDLIKHDYSTFDIFGDYGFDLNGLITAQSGWSFYDTKKTGAEIINEFYKTIRDAAKDMLIIGCNTLSHMSAGVFEINRIGDDTSGKYWCRTRVLGVNSLAFRLPQHKVFYDIDADCVGILKDKIPWENNRDWMYLLAKSGTPLFLSCQGDAIGETEADFIKKCFVLASKQENKALPLDWEYNQTPNIWDIDGEKTDIDWEKGLYPALLKKHYIPM